MVSFSSRAQRSTLWNDVVLPFGVTPNTASGNGPSGLYGRRSKSASAFDSSSSPTTGWISVSRYRCLSFASCWCGRRSD